MQSGDEWLQAQCSHQHVYCTFKKANSPPTTRNSSAWNLQCQFSSALQTGICSSAGRLPGTQWGSEVCKKEAIDYQLNVRNIHLNLVSLLLICWWPKVPQPEVCDLSGLEVWDVVLTCPWQAPKGPVAGWGPPSGPGMLWLEVPAGPPSASTSSQHPLSRSPLSSEEHHQSMLGVCLHFLTTQCRCVCVRVTCRLSVSPYSAWGFSDTCRWVVWFH